LDSLSVVDVVVKTRTFQLGFHFKVGISRAAPSLGL